MTNANKSVLEIENLESCSFLWGLWHPLRYRRTNWWFQQAYCMTSREI